MDQQPDLPEQASFEDVSRGDVVDLTRYRQELALRAAVTGQESARKADQDGFDAALEVIRDLAMDGAEFSADDVRTFARAYAGPAVGAAFAAARRAGLIVCVGFGVSDAPSRHGGLQRRWRGAT